METAVPNDFEELWPEYLSDEELEKAVRELERTVSEWKLRASDLERERDEARESAATARGPYLKLEREHQKEIAAHKVTRGVLNVVHVIALALLALLIGSVLLWWFVLR